MNDHDVAGKVSWGDPMNTGASYDFRSDVITTPSRSMLAAIIHTSLNDDVYEEDRTTASFEHEMATICGHEAAAFVITGTMANQLSLRTLLFQPPYAILTDAHSHIIHWEAGGTALVSGSVVQAIRPANRLYLTLNDIKKHAVLTDDVHKCPTRLVSLENTTSGTVIPLSELRRIKEWASNHGIAVHLDGARLWEAVSTGAGTLREFAQCADLTTLDFSKNLGAPMGAMVIGSKKNIKALKRIRKGLGGGMRQAGVLASAARQAVVENFGLGETCTKLTLRKSHDMAAFIARLWTSNGGLLLREAETNMVWVNLKAAGVGIDEWNQMGKKHGILLDGKRIVFHHQLCDSALARLGQVIEEVLGRNQLLQAQSKPVLAKL
ncbi:threonine aldolase [Paramyrothecium foliicola]|nr:threonine aldolase [Paramyrothecium foliicola]